MRKQAMEINRKTAMTFGLLLIAGFICGVFSSVLPIEEADYLSQLQSIESEILVGVFFQASMAVVYVAIAVITYPIVKMDSDRNALAYMAFRLIGAGFLFIGIVTLLLFIPLGNQYAQADANHRASVEMMGAFLRITRDGFNHIGMVLPWTIGGLFLYKAFLTTGLIPRWLSYWGLAAMALTLVATLLYMLKQIEMVSVTYFALNMPTALFEITLAIYLIARGFRTVSSTAGPV